MTKAEYLEQLRFSLSGKLPDPEIGEILRDYAEFFEDGKSANKSEEEISKELGLPIIAAQEIISEGRLNNKGVPFYWNKLRQTWSSFSTSGEAPPTYQRAKRNYKKEATGPYGTPPESAPPSTAQNTHSQPAQSTTNGFGSDPAQNTAYQNAYQAAADDRSRAAASHAQERDSGGGDDYTQQNTYTTNVPPPPSYAKQNTYAGAGYAPSGSKVTKSGGFGRALLSVMGGIGMVILAIILLPVGVSLLIGLGVVMLGVVAVLVALVLAFIAVLVGGVLFFSTMASLGAVLPISIYFLFFLALVSSIGASLLSICLIAYLVKGFVYLIRLCFGRQKPKQPKESIPYSPETPQDANYRSAYNQNAPYHSPFYSAETKATATAAVSAAMSAAEAAASEAISSAEAAASEAISSAETAATEAVSATEAAADVISSAAASIEAVGETVSTPTPEVSLELPVSEKEASVEPTLILDSEQLDLPEPPEAPAPEDAAKQLSTDEGKEDNHHA